MPTPTPPWLVRLNAETEELRRRQDALHSFLHAQTNDSVAPCAIPEEHRLLLARQYNLQAELLGILMDRLALAESAQ